MQQKTPSFYSAQRIVKQWGCKSTPYDIPVPTVSGSSMVGLSRTCEYLESEVVTFLQF